VGDARDDELRVFLEPSGYRWANLGDVMMLEAAVARVRKSWPGAALTVHVLDREPLRALDPAAQPLDPYGARAWSAETILIGASVRRSAVVTRLLEAGRFLRRRAPGLMARIAQASLAAKRRPPALAAAYRAAVRSADVVLMSGAGSLNDAFARNAFVVLETLELGIEAGAVTVMTGQGLGPMTDPALRRRAAAVLPRVDFIALREGLAGLPLLQSLGVAADRVAVTGDDAVAAAHRARPLEPGAAIGVNLRVAAYSGLDHDDARRIGEVVSTFGQDRGAPLLPVTVARDGAGSDLDTFRRMFAGVAETAEPATSAALLPQIGRCRIVVAGSYHAAALALSMGIPAVTVAASPYYVDKLQGLAGMFGDDCRVVLASERDFNARLRLAMQDAWEGASAARARLLAAAARQAALGEAAWSQVAEIVARRHARRPR
jgi:polysaccharide pyruvyl transferase WcaK-like protein